MILTTAYGSYHIYNPSFNEVNTTFDEHHRVDTRGFP